MVRKQNTNLKSTKKAQVTVKYRRLKKLNGNEVPWTALETFDNDGDEMLSTCWEALTVAIVLDVVDRHAAT